MPCETAQIWFRFNLVRQKCERTMKVLLVEDDIGDAALLIHILLESPDREIELEHVETLSAAFEWLDKRPVDIILLDLDLPDSNRLDTVRLMHSRAAQPAIIVLTGHQDESRALQCLQEGAEDYLIKGQADCRALVRSMRYALERKRSELEREGFILDLKEALAKMRTLTGSLPICSYCREIRDDKGSWSKLEDYVTRHSNARFSHGLCPNCAASLYPTLFEHGAEPQEQDLTESISMRLKQEGL